MPYKDSQSEAAKASNSRRNKRYYEKNKEQIIAYKKLNSKEYQKQWYLKNKERCKRLNSIARRKRMFGLDEETYNSMLKEQKECCKICGKHQSEFSKSLCVDHCHKTGKIRGLLCDRCNRSLGTLEDSIPSLKNAIKYLQDA